MKRMMDEMKLLNSKKEVKRVKFSDMSTVIVLRAKTASDIKATWLR
jgi:hypothetical protein